MRTDVLLDTPLTTGTVTVEVQARVERFRTSQDGAVEVR